MRARRAHHERVAIGRCIGRNLQAQRAACTGPVVENDRLAPALAHLLSKTPDHEVAGATRGKRDDEAYRLARVCLRVREQRSGAQERESVISKAKLKTLGQHPTSVTDLCD